MVPRAQVTTGGAEIDRFTFPGPSMIGKRHYLNAFSEDEIEEKTGLMEHGCSPC